MMVNMVVPVLGSFDFIRTGEVGICRLLSFASIRTQIMACPQVVKH
jgi:hypothetical protein